MPKRILDLQLRDKLIEDGEQTIDIWGDIGSERIFFLTAMYLHFREDQGSEPMDFH